MSDIQTPDIPSLSSQTPSEVRRAFDALRGWLKSIKSQGGVATTEGIVDAVGEALPTGMGDFAIPLRLDGFEANGAFRTIIISWDKVSTNYRSFSHVEIWRNTVDDLGTAEKVGTTQANVFTDAPPVSSLSVTYYYWGRSISKAQLVGPFNATAGTPASTANDPTYILQLLTGQLKESQLYATLNSRINLIDAPTTGLVTKVSSLETTTSAQASSISTLTSTVSGHTTSIQTNTTSINGLMGEYTVKIDNNGYVTGYGLASTLNNGTPTSEFMVVADKFSIAPVATSPTAADGSPFFCLTSPTVIDGVTVPAGAYMKNAYIVNLTSNNIKAQGINADRINVDSLYATVGQFGYLTATTITGQTFTGVNFIGGTFTGGIFETNNGNDSVVRMHGSSDPTYPDCITVHDENGTLRVRMGKLS